MILKATVKIKNHLLTFNISYKSIEKYTIDHAINYLEKEGVNIDGLVFGITYDVNECDRYEIECTDCKRVLFPEEDMIDNRIDSTFYCRACGNEFVSYPKVVKDGDMYVEDVPCAIWKEDDMEYKLYKCSIRRRLHYILEIIDGSYISRDIKLREDGNILLLKYGKR